MLTYVLSFIFVIGVLVLFHELGHFLVAKRSGIRVEAFSIGFGKPIFAFRRGDTEYRVSWIPFGGYVKMSGEDPEDCEGDEPWRFHRKSVPVRSAVILAGPVANLVLAVILYALIFRVWGVPVSVTTEIGYVGPDTPAANAGLRVGDRIVNVEGVPVSNFDELFDQIAGRVGSVIPLGVMRGGKSFGVDLELPRGTAVGIGEESATRLGSVIPGGPADRLGLKRGDTITAVNGTAVDRWSDLRSHLEKVIDGEVEISWERNGETLSGRITPDVVDEKKTDGTVAKVAKLQIKPYQPMERLGTTASIVQGTKRTGYVIENVFAFLKIVFTGQASRDMIGGPVQIFQVSGQQAKEGFDKLLLLMAFLSVQLGVLNLLPIPVLDGGHMVFLIAEAIRRKPLSINQRALLQQIGLIVILGLMATVTVFDVGRLIH